MGYLDLRTAIGRLEVTGTLWWPWILDEVRGVLARDLVFQSGWTRDVRQARF